MSATKPWAFRWKNSNMEIVDAAGNVIMCDESFYPWCPDDEADWHLIVAAVNSYKAPKENDE